MTDMIKKKLLQNLRDWIEARRRFRLSHAHVQMALELGMKPKKTDDQEPWKPPAAAIHRAPVLQEVWQGADVHRKPGACSGREEGGAEGTEAPGR